MPDAPPDLDRLRATLTDSIAAALDRVIKYDWGTELDDANDMRNEIDPDDHVFSSLVTLDNWLNDTSHTTESYLEDPDDEDDDDEEERP